MFGNIKKNNTRSLNIRLNNDKFYDFMLYKGETYGIGESDSDIATSFYWYDITEEGAWVASHVWGGAKNDGVELNNIGLTGVDNGLIRYDKNQISNDDFLNVLTKSKLEIKNGDNLLKLHAVTGNHNRYNYYTVVKDDYVELRGGFFQGFYKLDDKNYEVLPNILNNDWNFEFVLRKQDYEVDRYTLNGKYPENKGIFFYMGTRAENKFAVYYDTKDLEEDLDGIDLEYFLKEKPDYENLNGNFYLSKLDYDKSIEAYDSNCGCSQVIGDYFADVEEKDVNEVKECIIDDYFADEYGGIKTCADNGLPIDDDYFEAQINGDGLTVDGFEFDEHGYEKIVTDNKFVYFNQTKTGYTVDTWDESIEKIEFDYLTYKDGENKFVTFNQTQTGYTVDTWSGTEDERKKEYDVFDDLKENAFALKINDDNSIGYRYIVTNCEMPNNIEVIEEKSKPNIIKNNAWDTINVQVSLLGGYRDKCNPIVGKRMMKISFYVNGKLVLVSKSLPEFRFRRLKDVSQKQESVPFNISIGGGTQGLIDGVWISDMILPDTRFPLMKYFGGSFVGDLKSFRFYESFRDYPTINSTVFDGN